MSTVVVLVSSVCLSALAQIALKAGVSKQNLSMRVEHDSIWQIAVSTTLEPLVIAGMLSYIASMILWLLVLSRMPVSQAYPFVGLGIVITAGLGAFILGETITPLRALGIAFVVLGVVLVSRG